MKTKAIFFLCVLLFCSNKFVVAQGSGGGVWLEDDASCIGSIIFKNQANDGFGLAGGDGILLNTTIVDNKEVVLDSIKIKPGDIYCANGDIVDTLAYERRDNKDAIGVVFWINRDKKVVYPKGAVVSLNGQKEKSWGTEVLHVCKPTDQEIESSAYCSKAYKDTACYTTTRRMYDMYEGGQEEFEAGYWCWGYQFQDSNFQWCLATLTYLRRMFLVLDNLQATINYLKGKHPRWEIQFFFDSNISDSYYWSSSDSPFIEYPEYAFCVNFRSGGIVSYKKNGLEGLKSTKQLVRPIFLY